MKVSKNLTENTTNTKILADGTIARVGMIIVVIDGKSYGNNAKTITKITSLAGDKNVITCEAIDNDIGSANTKIPSWYESTSDLRKATAEERKQYWANKLAEE